MVVCLPGMRRRDRMDEQATVKVAASPLDLLPLCLLAWCFLVLGRTGPHHTTPLGRVPMRYRPPVSISPLHFKFVTPTARSFAPASHKRSGFLIS